MMGKMQRRILLWSLAVCAAHTAGARAGDLDELRARGVLRHVGVPYANFVTGSGDGLDVELMQRFAEHLGVRYEYVETDWENLIGDISGQTVETRDGDVVVTGAAPVRGDIAANGVTMLDWRAEVVDFAEPMFPTQVWLIARADAPIQPIAPSGDIARDIERTRALLRGRSVFGKVKSCLDPSLHRLAEHGAHVQLFEGRLNELAPAVIRGEAELTILDVPDALIAMEKWPGRIKIIGPMTDLQTMSCAFPQSSPELRQAFTDFFRQCCADGTYRRLVEKYYPRILTYYPDFFARLFPAGAQAPPES